MTSTHSRLLVPLCVLALALTACGEAAAPASPDAAVTTTSVCTSDADCTAPTGTCDPLTRACVACLTDAQCGTYTHCIAKACQTFTPCSNSLDCVPAKGADGNAQPICDKSIGECTACLTTNDCPEFSECIAKQCKSFTPCQNSTQCGSDQVCDPATSRCTQCVSDADCTGNSKCEGGACRAFVGCVSDKDCTPMGLLCDTSKGMCARCLSDADCPEVYNCAKTGVNGTGECAVDVCKQGQGACQGGKLVACVANGGGFGSAQDCPVSTACVAKDGLAACVDWACTPGKHCIGTDLVQCSVDGLEVVKTQQCGDGEACIGEACVKTVCTPNATYCEANAVKKCAADGLTAALVKACSTAEVCEAGACKAKICEPNAETCDGQKPAVCNATGTGFASEEAACAGGQICAGGKCASQLCAPATLFCDGGALKTCAPDGMSVSKSEPCGAGTFCGLGKTGDAGCQPQVCAPAQPSCTGTTATTCMPDGSGFAAGGVNCAASGKVCSGGACVALACDPLTPKFCEGEVAKTCSADGLTATIAKMCGAGMYCEAGYCQIQVCTPNAKFCTANKPAVCNANGSSVTSVGADCGSGATCVDGACQPHVCTPATLFCDGSTLKTCAPDGMSVSKSQLCGGGYWCGVGVSGDAGCQANVCDPGTPVCDGVTATTCKADGSGYAPLGVNCGLSGKNCSDGACVAGVPGMVLIPAGTFWMGCNATKDTGCDTNESPQHKVTLSAYYMDLTETTVAQYKACVDAGVCTVPSAVQPTQYATYPGLTTNPVNFVSWTQSQAYCKWRGAAFDLPTEAQWEMAARGSCELNGSTAGDAGCAAAMRTYPWGGTAPSVSYAVFSVAVTATVGSKPAGDSPYGLHDMAGNVWEWNRDGYGPYGAGAMTDPVGPGGASARVLRGGGFYAGAVYLRAGSRYDVTPSYAATDLGLRCIRTSP